MSLTSVLFPLPLTPVTATKHPSGMRTSMFVRLCSRAPRTVIQLSPGSRRRSGTWISRCAGEVLPGDRAAASARIASRSPSATTSPPCSPAPGPMSTMWSATRIVSSSCSTTRTVFPRSRRRTMVSMRRWLSRWCSPIDGSSSTYRHADEAAADLAREPDALRLTAGERPRRPVEAQVVEADVEQELESLVDLLEDPLRDEPLALVELHLGEERGGVADREVADLGDVLAADEHREATRA